MKLIIERQIHSLLKMLLLVCLFFMRGVDSDVSLSVTPLEGQPQNNNYQKYLLQGDITHPAVHYIYIMESSDSTRNKDGHCGTVLECLQAFLTDLHEFVAEKTTASSIFNSLIVFNDFNHVVYDHHQSHNHREFSLYDHDDVIYSNGGNRCDLALRQAATMEPTVVIFAGDGICDRNVTRDAMALGETGAVVHSIAVGDDSYCEDDFAHIPRNGGTCVSMPSSNHLSNLLLENYLLTTKQKNNNRDDDDALQFKVDNEEYQPFPNIDDGDATTTFTTALNLSKGTRHVVCVRNPTNEEEECFTIAAKDDRAASTATATSNNNDESISGASVAGTVIGVLAAFAVALLLLLFTLRKMVFVQKEIDTGDTANKYLANEVATGKEEVKQDDDRHEIL